MTSVDPRIAEQLDRFVPETAVVGEWETIISVAKRRSRRRRLVHVVTVGAVIALGVSPVGGAIAGRVGDFSSWLRGQPGTPASTSDQQAFDRANDRSWAGFPQGTKLRSLIRAEVGGHEYELFGFRSGNSLCLRIVGRGLNGGPALSCAPVTALRRAAAPVLVVQADHALGEPTEVPAGSAYAAPQAQATFGLVADGVEGVDLSADDGDHAAIVASNAFFYVDDKPKVGTRVREVFAIDSSGHKAAVPFQSAPFGEWDTATPAHDSPTGPSTVERTIDGGTIGWLTRREDRGEEPPKDAPYLRAGPGRGFEFARLITPDADSQMRILVGVGTTPFGPRPAEKDLLCGFLVSGGGAGGGCNPLKAMFSGGRGPFTLGESIEEGGDQYATLSGLASDDVARMQLFLATGETQPIPLRDNAWLVQAARADYPVRIAAYDRDDRIIGIQTMEGDGHTSKPVGEWRTVLSVPDEKGRMGEVRVARSSDGGRCSEIRLPGGGGGSGCPPKASLAHMPKLSMGINTSVDGAWVSGEVTDAIASVDVVLTNGKVINVETSEGFVLYPLGIDTTVENPGLLKIVGRDASGHQIAVFRPHKNR
jgi:hypothetical protein